MLQKVEGINQYSLSITEYLMHIVMDAKELLDKFVNQELNSQEKEELKALIKKDPEFKKEFVQEKAMQATIRARKKAQLKQELQGFAQATKAKQANQETQSEQPKKAKIIGLNTRRIVMAIAASLTLVLVSYFVFQNQTDYAGLYADNYKVYSYGLSMKRGNEENLIEGEKAYLAKDFQQAITYFLPMLKESDEKLKEAGFSKSLVHMYLGNSYLNTDQYQLAVQSFQKVVDSNDDTFQKDATWYLALSYLKLEDKGNAKQYLNQVIQEKSIYSKDAQKILGEL